MTSTDKVKKWNDFKLQQISLEKWVYKQGGTWKKSAKNVLHGIIDYKNNKASVCYFGKSRTIRLFYPYPGDSQAKYNFNSIEELDAFYKATK